MRFFLVISLISGILLIHGAATLSCLVCESEYITIVTGAEEEEESHYTKKLSKTEAHLSVHSFLDSDTFNQLNGYYLTSIRCNYESDRLDLPPELWF